MTTLRSEQLDAARRGPTVWLARLLGCTEGQVYTVALATFLALAAALVGLPPTMRDVVPTARTPSASAVATPTPPAETAAEGTDVPTPVARPAQVAHATVAGATAEVAPAAPARGVTGETAEAPAVIPPAPTPTPAVPPATGLGPAGVAARVGEPGAPDGVAVDGAGRVYVTTNNGTLRGGAGPSKVLRYGPDGTLEREITVAGQDAARPGGLTGALVAPDGGVLVLDSAPARVLRLDLDRSEQSTHAVLADLPACGPTALANACEAGMDDDPAPRAMALAADGALFVTDSGQGLVWRIRGAGAPEPWFVFPAGEAASGPTGIAIDGEGDVLVVTSMALQGDAGRGLVQRIDVRPDGTAGARSTLASTDMLSGPVGLAVTADGAIVVAFTASNVLVLLGPDGTERARLTAAQVEEHAEVPLDGPTGVAIRDRSVLVTNQSPTANDRSHWVVFGIPLA